MNRLGLELKILEPKEVFDLDGLAFTQAAFIWPNSESDLKQYIGDNGLIFFSELEKSLCGSGDYLIFTSVNGIAIESGWDYINVEYRKEIVKWEFWVNDVLINLYFNLIEYQDEIIAVRKLIMNLPQDVTLEPSLVIFPDD